MHLPMATLEADSAVTAPARRFIRHCLRSRQEAGSPDDDHEGAWRVAASVTSPPTGLHRSHRFTTLPLSPLPRSPRLDLGCHGARESKRLAVWRFRR